jgi:hypothetical protein
MFDPYENMKKIYLGKTVLIWSNSFSTMFFGKVIDINPAGIVVEPNHELSGRDASFMKEALPKGHPLLADGAIARHGFDDTAEVHAVFLDWHRCGGFRIVGKTDESKHALLVEDNILKKAKIENSADHYEC